MMNFDFCFWGKLLVAIPVLPAIGLLAASYFQNGVMQWVAGLAAMVLALYLARLMERLPGFSNKIVNRK